MDENESEWYQIDETLFKKNEVPSIDPKNASNFLTDVQGNFILNKTFMYNNCYNLTYIRMRWCLLSKERKEIELYDIINYTINRDDSTDPIKYDFGYIGAVIRNIPTLPYVTESKDITMTIYNWS